MLFLLFLPFSVASQKLSWEENMALQLNCGVRGEPYEVFDDPIWRIKEKIRRRRSLVAHGTSANFYQAPWSARLRGCTGTWISPRHVLTAAHCFYRPMSLGSEHCQIPGSFSKEDKFVKILLDCSLEDPYYDKCQTVENYETSYKVVKAIAPKKTFDCEDDYVADIILYEVEIQNGTYLQQYACLAEKKLGPRTDVELYGYGDTAGTSNRILNALNFTLQPDDTLHDKVISYATSNATCGGDSGAGYVYQEDEIIFLAAIHKGGSDNNGSVIPCGTLNVEKRHKATAVYSHLDWICLYSGVCREIEMYEEVMRRKEEIGKTVEVVTF